MAKNDLKQPQYGQGLVFNITDRICLGRLAMGWTMEPETEVVELPWAHVKGSLAIETNEKFRIRCKFREFTAQWLAAVTGNSVATGALYYKKAQFTASTTTITLSPAGTGIVDVVGIKYVAANTDRIIDSSAVQDVSFTRSSATLTMHASDAGNGGVFEIAYLYADTALADGKVIIDPTAFPGQVRLLLPMARINPSTGAVSYDVIDAQKCVPVKKPTIGGDVQQFHEKEMEFLVINENSGDLVYYCNGYNPSY